MVKDLRTFISEWEQRNPGDILRIKRPISAKWEVTALQTQLEKASRYPIVICEKPLTVDGKESSHRLVTNLTASRMRCAVALGINPRRAPPEWSEKANVPGRTVTVSRSEAPVKEVVAKEDAVDLLKFPIVWHHEMAPGPYITAGYVTTYDPESGVDNCSIQRLWVKAKNRTGAYIIIGQHNWNNAMKFWTKGEDAPVAVWIGHHPAALIPANVKKDYPASHYPLTGSFLGEPLRLVPTELWREKILVPADAEIVFEGVIPRNVHEAEGPFGEYTGYAGAQRPSWIIDVQRVTHRKDAMYHDIAGGAADHLVLGGFQMEARVYDVVKRVVPELQNVHVPISGCCRFHAYLQLRKTRPGIGKDAIAAAFAADFRMKHVFAVDEDIDIFNEKEILWALATRSQWNRDLTMLVGGTASTLDPSSGLPFGCRAGIDCTLPPPDPGMPPPFPVKNKVPDDVMSRIQLKDFLTADELAKMSNQ